MDTSVALESKLPRVGVTIFSQMSGLALEHGAINLSQGFPDFQPHPELVDRVSHHMRKGRNQYAPMQGLLALREAVSAKVVDLYGADYDPGTEITITTGATEALFAAIAAVVRPGDEVILIEPCYDAYEPIIRLNGGLPVPVKLTFPDYRIDWDRVRDAVGPATRLLILNSPHNPSGAVLTDGDMAALGDIVDASGILLLSDEVYEHIIFDGQAHQSLSRFPGLADRSFVISSFGKTYHNTGWKVGYCLAPEPLTRELQKVHQFLTFAVNAPIQHALADLLPKRELYLELGEFYQAKRDRFQALLAGSRFEILPCRGTYFQLLNYRAISDEPDMEFARRLTVEHKVAAIPPSVFYHDRDDHRVLRFCFAKSDRTLEKAAERLGRL
jgi:methionine aminotransferase